jgi:uncharacterized YigZ family protein
MNKIKTVADKSEFKFKEKGSLFIGQVFPVGTIEEAETILSDVRKKFYDASHNCYAYKLIGDKSVKYSDDGEPTGTAGIRILNAINHFELFDVLIISTRYFGGIKLGVGPLGKAYYNSAVGAVENARIIDKEKYTKVSIVFEYNFISDVHHYINQYKVKEINNLFDTTPAIECLIKDEFVKKLTDDLTFASNGKIDIKILANDIFLPV